ncbi:hypothetical protein BDV3_002924 [Batrachochytrium dendrobatidis]
MLHYSSIIVEGFLKCINLALDQFSEFVQYKPTQNKDLWHLLYLNLLLDSNPLIYLSLDWPFSRHLEHLTYFF